MSLVGNFFLSAGSQDGWKWKPSSNGEYSVKSAYGALIKSFSESRCIVEGPSSIQGDNYGSRVPTEALCVACKCSTESVKHLFFSCEKSSTIWYLILKWFGKQSALHISAADHLLSLSSIGRKSAEKFLTGVWICVIWSISRWRNECKFNKNSWDSNKIFLEIKSRLWGWRLAYNILIASPNFRSCCSSDLLDIDH